MTLNIAQSQRTDGLPGTHGTGGTNGTDAIPNGGNGGSGQAGDAVALGRDGLVLLGDAGGDRVSFELHAVGGAGGGGGGGGTGDSSSATVTFTNSPGSSLTEAVYGVPGAGGAGGSGGVGGTGDISYTNLDIDLAGSVGTQNSLRLNGTAWGGNGGSGGTSGSGGSSGYTSLSSSTTLGPPAFTTTYSQLGTAGGAAPDGADGGAGATGTVFFDNISVVGQNNLVQLYGTAAGGSGSGGGSGSRGGSGSTGASGGDGGDGGDGALGLAEATRLDVQAMGGLNLTVYLDARGGQGNQGGGGGNAGSGQTINGNFTNGVGSTLNTTIYAGNGRGGDGGNGGDGVARLADSTITGSTVTDNVLLYMRAAGGLGGPGGGGAPEVASSTTTGTTTTTVVQGTPASIAGSAGTAGNALVEIRNITVSLGDGNDRLEFDVLSQGPGLNRVIVSGNSFDGGIGTDRLILGTGKLGEPGAMVNANLGFFRLGSSPVVNTMTGFEVFDGTLAADRFTGGAGAWTYTLKGGNDTFDGGAGHDSVDGGDDDDLLNGRGGNDTLLGGAGADTLAGGHGADSLVGGTGNDLYLADAIDIIVELPGGGSDTVRSAGSHVLAAEVEVLELTGALNVSGTGNALDNIILGNAGNNRLDGGGGADTMIGGLGNDRYVVDASDIIIELAGGGIDTVQTADSYTLADELEALQLTGALNVNGTGNARDNTLTGNDGNNRLSGEGGNDTLVGGRGADTLIGGADNDLYVVDAIDVIVELPGGGIDTVQSAGSHVLAAEVEVLELTGALNVNGTGNASDNLLIGNAGNNRLNGEGGNDTLLGGEGADRLTGGQGADSLVGGAGNDLYVVDAIDTVVELAGGGNDTVQSAGSHTLAAEVEALQLTGALNVSGTGNATDNRLTGNAGTNRLTGEGGNDTLLGGDGADTLDGGAGRDRLTGGNDADLFLFSAIPPSTGEADSIIDFTVGIDSVGVLGAAFDMSLAAGALDPSRFLVNLTGQAAIPGLGVFIFESDAGRLWWDADGRGGAARDLVATLRGGVILGADDILVV